MYRSVVLLISAASLATMACTAQNPKGVSPPLTAETLWDKDAANTPADKLTIREYRLSKKLKAKLDAPYGPAPEPRFSGCRSSLLGSLTLPPGRFTLSTAATSVLIVKATESEHDRLKRALAGLAESK